MSVLVGVLEMLVDILCEHCSHCFLARNSSLLHFLQASVRWASLISGLARPTFNYSFALILKVYVGNLDKKTIGKKCCII